MDLASIETILSAIANIITVAAPIAVQAEQNIQPFAIEIYQLATGTNLTNSDVDAALARVNALSAQIQDPSFIAPAQPDDV